MRYWVETLGCPKNQVDSDKLAGTLEADGYGPAARPGDADLVVVNTCAFVEAARQESIETALALADARRPGARIVLTGCLAERYGEELAEALPEVDLVAGFGASLIPEAGPHGPLHGGASLPGAGVPVRLGPSRTRQVPAFDLLNLPRPATRGPWAYVKVAEGCDRRCGFCAIPSFRGRQRSRTIEDVLAEVDGLGVQEVVLVAQDLASFGRDAATGHRRPGAGPHAAARPIETLVGAVAERVARTRLLYLYPSELTDGLIDVMGHTGCPYFDLSLQHVSRPHLRRMRRWGDGERFLSRIERIRAVHPDAALRSSFIVGYPGETEEDHDQLLAFLADAQLDWAGFFPFSPEEGTHAVTLPDQVPGELVAERLAECSQLQDTVTAGRRAALVGQAVRVLVDEPGVARSHREAPEIDGVIRVPATLAPGTWADVVVTGAEGPDLDAAELG